MHGVLSQPKNKIWGDRKKLGTPPAPCGVDFLVFFVKNEKYLESCEMVHVAMCEYTWYKLHMCVPVPVYEHMHAFVCAHVYVVCVESFSDSI